MNDMTIMFNMLICQCIPREVLNVKYGIKLHVLYVQDLKERGITKGDVDSGTALVLPPLMEYVDGKLFFAIHLPMETLQTTFHNTKKTWAKLDGFHQIDNKWYISKDNKEETGSESEGRDEDL
eukprot:13704349-Ditylum_brightwellii.AAC.1